MNVRSCGLLTVWTCLSHSAFLPANACSLDVQEYFSLCWRIHRRFLQFQVVVCSNLQRGIWQRCLESRFRCRMCFGSGGRAHQCWVHVHLSRCEVRSPPVRATAVNLGEKGSDVSSSPTCSARQIAILAKVEIQSPNLETGMRNSRGKMRGNVQRD